MARSVGNGSLTPPGQGLDGIKWEEEKSAEGHILMGSSASGAWVVAPGAAAGTIQTTDPHQLTIAEMPRHSHSIAILLDTGLGGGGTTHAYSDMYGHSSTINTNSAGGDQPHIHTLVNLQRYGVKIWKRVA